MTEMYTQYAVYLVQAASAALPTLLDRVRSVMER